MSQFQVAEKSVVPGTVSAVWAQARTLAFLFGIRPGEVAHAKPGTGTDLTHSVGTEDVTHEFDVTFGSFGAQTLAVVAVDEKQHTVSYTVWFPTQKHPPFKSVDRTVSVRQVGDEGASRVLVEVLSRYTTTEADAKKPRDSFELLRSVAEVVVSKAGDARSQRHYDRRILKGERLKMTGVLPDDESKSHESMVHHHHTRSSSLVGEALEADFAQSEGVGVRGESVTLTGDLTSDDESDNACGHTRLRRSMSVGEDDHKKHAPCQEGAGDGGAQPAAAKKEPRVGGRTRSATVATGGSADTGGTNACVPASGPSGKPGCICVGGFEVNLHDMLRRSVLNAKLVTPLDANCDLERPRNGEKMARFLPNDPAVKAGVLDNGMRWYARLSDRPKNRAELRLMVRIGSLVEEDDEQGYAHLLEHLLFRKTKHFEDGRIVKYMESVGMAFGADTNAHTSLEETIYKLSVPTDNIEAVKHAMLIMRDWCDSVLFTDEIVESEKKIVWEEWRLSQNASRRVGLASFQHMFKGSRFAHRLPIGKSETIKAATADKLRRFYKKWYHPMHMGVAVVGNFDNVDQVVSMIKKTFSDVTGDDKQVVRLIPEYPVPMTRRVREEWDQRHADDRHFGGKKSDDVKEGGDGGGGGGGGGAGGGPRVGPNMDPEVLIILDPELTRTSISCSYSFPLPLAGFTAPQSYSDTASFLDAVMCSWALSALNQRLERLASSPEAPFFGAGVSSTLFANDAENGIGNVFISVSCASEQKAKALEVVLQEIWRLALFGVTEREYMSMCTSFKSRWETNLKQRKEYEARYFTQGCVNNFINGHRSPPPGFFSVFKMALLENKVFSLQMVNRMAAQVLTPYARCNMQVTVSEPPSMNDAGRTSDPAQTDMVLIRDGDRSSSQQKDLGRNPTTYQRVLFAVQMQAQAAAMGQPSPIRPWQERRRVTNFWVPPACLQPSEPSKVTYMSHIDAYEVLYPNGLRVVLKHRDYNKDTVLIRGFALGGFSEFSEDMWPVTTRAVAIADDSGLGPHSILDVDELLQGHLFSGGFSISPYYRTYSGGMATKSIRENFQAMTMHMATQRLDGRALEVARKYWKDSIRNLDNSPGVAFSRAYNESVLDDNYMNQPIRAHQYDTLHLPQFHAAWRAMYSNPGEYTFFVVGALPTSDPTAQLEQDANLSKTDLSKADEAPAENKDAGAAKNAGKEKTEGKSGGDFMSYMLPLLNGTLGALPGQRKTTKLPKRIPISMFNSGVNDLRVYKGQSPLATVSMCFPIHFHPTDTNGQILSICCQLLSAALLDRLRSEMGSTYTVSVNPVAVDTVLTDRRVICIEYGCKPENVDQMRAAVIDVLEIMGAAVERQDEVKGPKPSAKAKGPSAESVAAVKEQRRRAFELNERENGYWAGLLLSVYLFREYEQAKVRVMMSQRNTVLRERATRLLYQRQEAAKLCDPTYQEGDEDEKEDGELEDFQPSEEELDAVVADLLAHDTGDSTHITDNVEDEVMARRSGERKKVSALCPSLLRLFFAFYFNTRKYVHLVLLPADLAPAGYEEECAHQKNVVEHRRWVERVSRKMQGEAIARQCRVSSGPQDDETQDGDDAVEAHNQRTLAFLEARLGRWESLMPRLYKEYTAQDSEPASSPAPVAQPKDRVKLLEDAEAEIERKQYRNLYKTTRALQGLPPQRTISTKPAYRPPVSSRNDYKPVRAPRPLPELASVCAHNFYGRNLYRNPVKPQKKGELPPVPPGRYYPPL